MKTTIFQHVRYEGPGLLAQLDAQIIFVPEEPLPALEDIGLLIILGGPMSATEENHWLHAERQLIKAAIEARKPVLGICLGAQLIAQAIGGEVFKNPNGKEVGFMPVYGTVTPLPLGIFPDELHVLHWHGDTYRLPPSAMNFYRTNICENQAFFYTDRVVGLQFHLETTADDLQQMLQYDGDYLTGEPFVQSAAQMQATTIPTDNATILMNLVQYLQGRLAFK